MPVVGRLLDIKYQLVSAGVSHSLVAGHPSQTPKVACVAAFI